MKWKRLFSSPCEDASDSISRLLTSLLLITAAAISYHRSTSGRILQCRAPPGLEQSLISVPPVHYVESECATQPIYVYRDVKDSKFTTKTEPDYVLDWAPFVPYMLAIAALFALSPNLFRLIRPCTVLDHDLIRQLTPKDQGRVCSIVADRILKKKLQAGSRFHYVLSKKEKCRRFSSGPLISHFAIKFYTMAVLICILQLVKTMFPLTKNFGFIESVGSMLVSSVAGTASAIRKESFIFQKLFPMDFVCLVQSRTISGKIAFENYRCIFTLNSLYACLFLIFAMWLIFASFCQAVSIFSWILALFVSRVKKNFVKRALENTDLPLKTMEWSIDRRFIDMVMTADVMLAMYELRLCVGQYAVDETVKVLWAEYRREEDQKGKCRDQMEMMV